MYNTIRNGYVTLPASESFPFTDDGPVPDREHIYQIFHPFEKKDDEIVWGEKRACRITRSSIKKGLEQFLEGDESQ